MGFFKNLFEKKACDICGGEIGMLGNRKLEDGNCCKECAKKLSPWFTERKHSTVEEIKQQIDSREANRQAVAAFHRTRSYGKTMMVYLDEDHRKLMVTDAQDLEKENPDVLDFSQVTACDVNVVEAKNEVYRQVRDEEGKLKNESYSPRRYKYSYEFRMKIRVNHPYIEEIAFSLSGGYFPVRVENRGSMTSFLFGSHDDEYGPDGSSANPPTQADFRANDDYVRYERWGQEIRDILFHSQETAPAVPENALESMIAKSQTAAQAYENAKASGDPMQTMEAAKAKEAQDLQLHEVYMNVLRGESRKNEPALSCLVADYTACEEDILASRQSGSTDRLFAAMNSKEILMKKSMEARKQDPEGFQASGFLEALQKYSTSTRTQTAPAPTLKVTCPYCGSQVDAGKFCGNCGAKLD